MKSAKRILAMLLVLVMMTGMLSAFAAAPGDFADFPHGTWSEAAMTAAVGNGLLQGKGVNTIAPKDYLTRAEAATIINRAFGATVTKDISQFTDVTPGQWYYVEMQKAANMETIVGTSSTTMDPLGYITRESMMTVLARALVLSDSDTSSLSKFADGASVSSWAAPYVAAMTRLGYVNGDGNGYINPQAYITREEFAQIMHNTIKTYITASSTVKDVTYNTTLIRTPGVTLENVVINGDLIIGDGVGAGDVNLTNVKVSGRILFRGGEGKVTLKKTTVGEYIVVHDVNGTVNFNNYETEMVFDDHLQNTPATFLKKPGSTVGGGVSRKSYTVNVYLMKLDGTYSDTPDDTDIVSAKSGATITYNTGKTGFTLDTAKSNLTGTNNGSLVINAYYTRNKYKVSYGDYETELYYEQPINADTTLIEKMNADKNADPNTTGYEFVRFEDADGNAVDDTTEVGAKDLEIKAVKTPKVFNISYDRKGYGTLPQDAKTSYTIEDEDYILPVLTDDNNIFGGWYDNEEFTGEPIAIIKKGITVGALNLFAKWTPKTPGTVYHKIYFGGNPYDVENDKPLSTNGALAQAMAGAAKAGYTLTFTATDKNGNPIAGDISVDTVATQEMTITAVHTVITYTITYYDAKNGNEIAENALPNGAKTSYTIETETFELIDLPDTTTHEFDGWYDASNDTLVTSIAKGSTGNREFYATWTKIDTTEYVTITFNNKTYKVVKNKELSTNTELKKALIASQDEVDPKTGYQRYFEGYWESNGQTQSEIVTVGSVARRDMTIEAKYGTITYYINYYLSKTDENRDHYVEYNVETEDFDHYIPTHDEPDKYTFGGWYNKTTDVAVGTTVKKGTIGHMALYAKWIDKTDKKYTVDIYLQNFNGEYVYEKTIEDYAAFNAQIDYQQTLTGFTLNEGHANSKLSGTNDGNLKLVAYYSRNKYNVQLREYSVELYYGQKILGDDNEFKTRMDAEAAEQLALGYNMWFNATIDGQEVIIDADTTVPAHDVIIWGSKQAILYKIDYYESLEAYDNGNGTPIDPAGAVIRYSVEDETFSLPVLEDTETHTFEGWYDVYTNTKVERIEKGSMGNRKFYAKWKEIVVTLLFDYEKEGNNVEVYVKLNKLPAGVDKLTAITLYYTENPLIDDLKWIETTTTHGGNVASSRGAISWYDAEGITAQNLADANGILFTILYTKDNADVSGKVTFAYGYTELASGTTVATGYDKEEKEVDLGTEMEYFTLTFNGVTYKVKKGEKIGTAEGTTDTLAAAMTAKIAEEKAKGYDIKFMATYDDNGTQATVEVTADTVAEFDMAISTEPTPIEYNINYELGNIGVLPDDARKTYTVETETFALPELDDTEDYTFEGWYELVESQKNPVTEVVKGSRTGDLTFYADWKAIEPTLLNVNFYEGTRTLKATKQVESGNTLLEANIDVDTVLPPAEYEMEYGYTDSDGKAHEIAPELWYQVDGEWELFDPATVKIVKDTDVHLLTRFATIYYDTDIKIKGVKVPKIELSVAYDSNTDIIKSGLDLLTAMGDVLESTLYDVENYGGVDIFQTALDKAAKTGLIDENGNLLNPNVPVPLHKLLTEDLIMKEIDNYIDNNLNNEEFISEILKNDTVVDMLLGDDDIRKKVLGDEDMRKKLLTDSVINTMIQKEAVVDYIIHNETFKKKFIDSNETFEYILGDLKELLDNNDYHKMIIDACVEFVVDVYFREDGDPKKVNAPELVDYIDEVLDSDDVIKDIEGNIDRDHFKEQIKGLIADLLKPENAATKNKIYEEIRKSNSFKQAIIDAAINNPAIKASIMEDVRTDLASANSKYKDTVITAVRAEFDKTGSELKDNIIAAVKTDLGKGSASALRATVSQAVKDDLAKDKDNDDSTTSALKSVIVEAVKDDLAKAKDNDDTTNSVLKGAIVSAVSKDFEKGTESTLKSTIEDTVKTEIQTAGSDLRDTILDSAATGSLAATVKAYAQDNGDIRDSVKNNADVKTSVKAEAKTWLTDSDNLNTVKADLKTAVVGNKDALSIAILNSGYEITAGTPISKADADDLAGKYLGLNGESLDSGVKAEIDDAIDSFFGDDNNVKLIDVLEDEDNFNTIYNTAYDDIFDKLYADSTVFDKAYATYIGGASGRTNLEDAFDKYISVPDNLENAIDTFVNNSDNLEDAIDVYISNTSDLSAAIDAYLELSDDLTDAIDLYIDNASSDDIEKAINTYIEDDDNLIKAINTYIAKPTDSTQPDKLEEVFDIFTADKANLLTAFDAYIGDGKNGDNTNLDKAFAEFTGDPTALETFYNTYLGNNAQDPSLFNKLFEEYYHTHVHDVAKEAYKDKDLNGLVMKYVRKYTDEMVVKYANGDLAKDEDHKDLAATIDKLMADEFPKVIREQYYMEGSTIKTTVDSLIETEGTKLIKQYAVGEITDTDTINFIKKTIDDNIGIIVDDYVAGTLKADIKVLVDAEIDAYMQRLIDEYINNVGDARQTLGELIPTYAKDAVDTLKATDAFKNTIKDFTSGNGVRVNKDNKVFISMLPELMDKYDYDKIMEDFAPAKLKTIVDKVGADIARKYVNTLLNTFVADINKALDDLEANNNEGEYKFSTTPRVRVYYMKDFVVNYYNKGMPKIVSKLNSKELIANNPYAQKLVNKNWITELLDYDATAVSEEMSGYSLKKGGRNGRYDSPIITYYDIALENVVLLHDAIMWYGTSEGTIEAKLDAASALIGTYANKANDAIIHYINTGELPKGYTPYEIADTILNKVLGINGKIDDAYDKVEDKYYENEERILELVQKAKDFYEEKLNRDYSDIVDLASLSVYADGEAYPIYKILLEISEEDKAFNIDTAATAIFDSDNYHGINKVENAMAKVKSKLEQYKVKNLPSYAGRFMRDAYRATLDAKEIKGYSTGTHTVEAQRYLK